MSFGVCKCLVSEIPRFSNLLECLEVLVVTRILVNEKGVEQGSNKRLTWLASGKDLGF